MVSLNVLGLMADRQDDYATARAVYAQAAAACEELGDTSGLALAMGHQGLATAFLGDPSGAERLSEAAVSLAGPGHTPLAWTCLQLAYVRLLQGEYLAARALCLEVLAMPDDTDHGREWHAAALRGLASIATATGMPERGLRLFAAAAALRPRGGGVHLTVFDGRVAEYWRGIAGAGVDEEAAVVALSAGAELSLEQALAYALDEPVPAGSMHGA